MIARVANRGNVNGFANASGVAAAFTWEFLSVLVQQCRPRIATLEETFALMEADKEENSNDLLKSFVELGIFGDLEGTWVPATWSIWNSPGESLPDFPKLIVGSSSSVRFVTHSDTPKDDGLNPFTIPRSVLSNINTAPNQLPFLSFQALGEIVAKPFDQFDCKNPEAWRSWQISEMTCGISENAFHWWMFICFVWILCFGLMIGWEIWFVWFLGKDDKRCGNEKGKLLRIKVHMLLSDFLDAF